MAFKQFLPGRIIYQPFVCPQINVNCPEGNNWKAEKYAVAMIVVDGIRICSGSLVNTMAIDYTPYFLTANHCLMGNDAVIHNSPLLTSWSFYWQYESPGCSDALPTIRSTVGAKLIANNDLSDFALLKLLPFQKVY